MSEQEADPPSYALFHHLADTGQLDCLISGITTGCKKQPSKNVGTPLPKIEIADIPAPASATVTVARGSNLQAIAIAAYASESMSGFVMTLNGIPRPERLLAGSIVNTPSIPVAFRDAGLDPSYQPAINVLAKAWADFPVLRHDYEEARDKSVAGDGETFAVPGELQSRLVRCADMIDAATEVLCHGKSGHYVPEKAAGAFSGVAATLRRFATGAVESRDYETFMTDQTFARGFTSALIWTLEHHQ